MNLGGILNMSNEELYQFIEIIAECTEVALVDSQVILQLLVKKGIITKEEVDETRALVRDKSELAKAFGDAIDKFESRHNETNDLKELLRKSIYDREKMTPEEHEKILSILSKIDGK